VTRLITTPVAGLQRVARTHLGKETWKNSHMVMKRARFAKISIRFNFALTGRIGWHTNLQQRLESG
jgi:hypothetical protein